MMTMRKFAFGRWLMVAALACGAYWGWLTLVARSIVPAFVSHLMWDLAVMFWLPYGW
mgnify:CR=1 FL=1